MPSHVEPTSRQTLSVRGGIATDTQHGAVIPPLHLSANFTFAAFGEKRDFDYTRSGNPTRAELGSLLAALREASAESSPRRGCRPLHWCSSSSVRATGWSWRTTATGGRTGPWCTWLRVGTSRLSSRT